MKDLKKKSQEITNTKTQIATLILAQDPSNENELDLRAMIKSTISIFDTLGQDQNTISKKWQTVLGSKSKFNNSQKVVRTTDSLNFLKGLNNIRDTLKADVKQQTEVLVHLGNIADKL